MHSTDGSDQQTHYGRELVAGAQIYLICVICKHIVCTFNNFLGKMKENNEYAAAASATQQSMCNKHMIVGTVRICAFVIKSDSRNRRKIRLYYSMDPVIRTQFFQTCFFFVFCFCFFINFSLHPLLIVYVLLLFHLR